MRKERGRRGEGKDKCEWDKEMEKRVTRGRQEVHGEGKGEERGRE